jgi:hypothetical protein
MQAYPTYIFFDKSGKIADAVMGYSPTFEQGMINMIEKLTAE